MTTDTKSTGPTANPHTPTTTRRAVTLFDLSGGAAALTALAHDFYGRVLADPLLIPLFADPTEDHAGRMADWLIEITGGPPRHSASRGGFSTMVRAHGGLGISEAQRGRWASHMMAACEETRMAPEFLGHFRKYIEGGSHLAMRQSR